MTDSRDRGTGAEIDRRGFIAALPAAALLVGCGAGEVDGSPNARARVLDRLGVQLYTLRSVIADDVEGVLAAVAEIGYREVELAGLYGLTPAEFNEKLDDAGLVATSSHQSVAEVRGDWQAVLDRAVTLGQSLVVVPSIPTSLRTSEELRRLADDFNRAGEAARAAGLRFGYHNHDWEHRALTDGTVPIDLLLERTDPALVDWQMDIFWTVHGGADPMRYLREAGGRVTSVHVKDRTASGDMASVGRGVIDFVSILPEAERLGLLHAFVENDRPGDDPVEDIRRSYRHLDSL